MLIPLSAATAGGRLDGDGPVATVTPPPPHQNRSQHWRLRHAGYALLATAVIALDLSSKLWARAHLAPAGRDHPTVSFAVVHNQGATLGIGSGQPEMVGAVEVIGVLVVAWWLWTASSAGQRACAAVVLGGAAGNLFDRLRHGAVTDWIHLAPYPPYFNIADLAIRGGLAAAVVLALCRYRDKGGPSRAVGLVGPIRKRRGAAAAEVSGHCKDPKRPGGGRG